MKRRPLSPAQFWALLPALIKAASDATLAQSEALEPLRTLLEKVETQAEVIRRDVEALYEDWFVETEDDWILPYIGDLVDASTLSDGTNQGRPQAVSALRLEAWADTLRPVVQLLESLSADTSDPSIPRMALELRSVLADMESRSSQAD